MAGILMEVAVGTIDRGAYDLDAPASPPAPIVKLCNLAISEGLLNGARAIRFQPIDETFGGVEYEIDGSWRLVMKIPIIAFGLLINRLKYVAALDVARRTTQDGELNLQFHGTLHTFTIHTEESAATEMAILSRNA